MFQAAAETWLPLLEVIDTCREEGIRPAWTVGLMPILLEQLRHPRFQEGFVEWLVEGEEQAARDQAEFEGSGQGHLAWLAERHQRRHRQLAERFEALDRDIPGALIAAEAEGLIELLTSNATHAYHPLVLHDRCARAQVRAGIAASTRHLGHKPRGAWLPECAYRPGQRWVPPVLHGDSRDRTGVAQIFAEEGIGFFFVDHPLIAESWPVGTLDHGAFQPVDGDQAGWDTHRAWRSVNEPVRVVEWGQLTSLTALGRSPEVSEQVWSGKIGYPGDSRYLEFHKRHGPKGHKYWKITGRDVDLGEKDMYYPDDVAETLYQQAAHFVQIVKDKATAHRDGTQGRYGVICAPFDAELFGHWWFEGPQFLLEVARRLHHEDLVDALTVSEYLERAPADKAAALPEGTWGAGGDHRVWLNEELTFYWETAYRAEDRFLHLWHTLPWRTEEGVAELLTEAGRQLLLLQASDWPFVIHTGGAVDYGMRRILDHAGRFDDLCNGSEDRARGVADDPVVLSTLARSRLLDPVFPELDLEWWA